ncbi:hypothetical protein Cantr_02535 [Candida viswanathii]|uniref:Calcium channel YVC1 n=1 Tax=Candida viswanathii TaxID=5486 RepID=A0A367YLT9_9ASCO|nr:hypothetical protein Cantr_02535 [Candida viswanathii]
MMLRYTISRKHDFKTHYFKIQKLINTKVHLSLKYEQLKSPEIHLTLMRPITQEILSIASDFDAHTGQKISSHVIFILLLLRYEYLIQSENNLIAYDLLVTKATVCEILSVRMLREYASLGRIKMLFIRPMLELDASVDFNTLELCVLSDAKRFLSQPIVVRILERFYNGELINNGDVRDDEKCLLGGPGEEEGDDDCVTDYRFDKVSMRRVVMRANTVPKYQSLVINCKFVMFLVLYFLVMCGKPVEVVFWLFGASFNIELMVKMCHIEWKFMRMIIWNYIDFLLILLIDVSFVLQVTGSGYFKDVFSLIGIILFPRILSIFNNYVFFNLIVLSFNKMIFNLIGLIFFFFTLISGFYFSFITLSTNQTNGEILFNMIKIFFGFTPSVWNNWDNYNMLGKAIQMSYLFLIQFIVGTILAICLSGIFIKVRENNQEEFNYFKATNLILYFKMAKLNKLKSLVNTFLHLFKIPIICLLFGYEIVKSKNYVMEPSSELKNFTFLKPEMDESDGLVSYRRPSQRRPNKYQSYSTLGGGGHLRTASTDSFFINELLAKKYGKVETTRTNTTSDRATSKKLNQPFSIPRQRQQQPPQFHASPASYIASPPPPPPVPSSSNSELLSRFANLENIIAKHANMPSSLDDTKSVMMYDIRETEDIDEILISSSSGTTHDHDEEEDEPGLQSSKDDDTMEDIDQYDSDETF